MKMPMLGLGTWQMGGRTTADYSQDKKEILAIQHAIEMGYSLIDTAELYGNGHAEELIGVAMKGFDRKKLFIVSKVFWTHLKHDQLLRAAEESLKRLGTDYLDCYLIHAPGNEVPIEETMRAMGMLVKEGLTQTIGVSNFNVPQLQAAMGATENPILTNQIQYSLTTRNHGIHTEGMERDIIPFCQKNNITIMAYRPLEKGLLTQPNPMLDELAQKYSKTRAQIALNWLITKNMVTIPKSSDENHLRENLGALGWNLSSQDMKKLDETKF